MKKTLLSTIALTMTLSSYAFAYTSMGPKKQDKGCAEYEPNWHLVDEYVHLSPNGTPTITYPVGMFASKQEAGKVYVTGVSIDTENGQYIVKSIIRRTTNFGGNWSTSNFVYNSENGGGAIHTLEAPNGRLLYLAESHVFSSTNLGLTFSEIANLSTQFPQYSNITLLDGVIKDNTIYMVANGKSTINGQYNWRGLLFTSTNNGVTWTLKKMFNKGDANITWLTSVAVKSSGRVVVGGYVRNGSDYYWLVDQSNTAISSWSELETSLPPGGVISYVRALEINDNDQVLALGPLVDSSSVMTTYIRRYGNTATTVYQSAPGAQGTDLYKTEAGKIYFPYTLAGMARMAVSSNDGSTWNDNWSSIDPSTYSYEMGEDKKNNLYVSSQDGSTLKTYKLECKKSCNHK